MKLKGFKYLTVEEIVEVHERIIDETGGESGPLNMGNLGFVLDQIQTEFYGHDSGDLFTQAAILIRGIICGHPFVDGNKRTGFEATDLFLNNNGYYIDVDVLEGVGFTVAIATGKFDISETRTWLLKHIKKL
ncbi:MAG: type II toxin-antitoxin system death-on-curing family toxin [Euryarchaeota archaeon]|nr:type II toxin-antitoxin system death-on-curing family toxin [Euryarchaeota archaeon]